ncbi:MAG TPA: hypothetical protein VEU31_04545 [Candidatus Acidoferrales bacterium]|nr:hypothetical protein [Candidatus Acidoferrales bacterium]
MGRLLVAVLSLSLSLAPASVGTSTPLGVVTAAERAQLRALPANKGDSVFDGDTLSTDMVGLLQVRAIAARFQLAVNSVATVTQTPSGILTTLTRGTEVWSAARAGAIELHASQARIRPVSDGPTVGQVTLVSPKELLVTARRGALEITVEDETQIVPEATSYRVLLDPPDPQQPQGAGGGSNHRKKMILIPIIVGSTPLIVWLLHELFESPDRP